MGFVTSTTCKIYNIQNPMCLLKQSERFVKGVSVDQLDGTTVQFNQNERNLLLCHLEFSIVMLVELFPPNHGLVRSTRRGLRLFLLASLTFARCVVDGVPTEIKITK